MTHQSATAAIKAALKNGQFVESLHGRTLEARVGRVPAHDLPDFVDEILELDGFITLGRIKEVARRYEDDAKTSIKDRAKERANRAWDKLAGALKWYQDYFYDNKIPASRYHEYGLRKMQANGEHIFNADELMFFARATRAITEGYATPFVGVMSLYERGDSAIIMSALYNEIYRSMITKELQPLQSLPAPKKSVLAGLPKLRKMQ